MGKHILEKIILDPLDFLEYFCPEGDLELGSLLFGYRGMLDALKFHTVNPEYAKGIADKFKRPLKCTYPNSQSNLQEFLRACQGYSNSETDQFLVDRGFQLSLKSKYQVGTYKFQDLKGQVDSVFPYFLVNEDELDYASYKLGIDFQVESFLVCPSFAADGSINNLAFRAVSPRVQGIAKWIFMMGRQSTFGLHLIDPAEPVHVVEGFFDYVACQESGIQSVGIGSAFMSEAHWKLLEHLDLKFLLDSDETGRKSSEALRNRFEIINLSSKYKDPWESWVSCGKVLLED